MKSDTCYKLSLSLTVLCVLGFATTWPADADTPSYTIIDLGTLGSRSSTAYGINNKGQVVGEADSPTGGRAFLYNGGPLQDLGTLGPGEESGANGINKKGQVVGHSGGRAFLYSGGSLQDLGVLPGYKYGDAYGINNKGQVVGDSYNNEMGDGHAFLYSNGKLQDLGTLGGGSSWAYGINSKGQVVGASGIPGNGQHAFLYSDGKLQDLGSLGSNAFNDDYSTARSINNKGQIVGDSTYPSKNFDAPFSHAFLYSNGVMTDLNSLIPANSGWVLENAFGINKAGQIVGGGTINGQFHAFLATPVNTDNVTTQSKDSADEH